jgi:sugar lactone lactonase YvrE
VTVPTTEARVWFDPPTEADRFLLEGPRAMPEGVIWVNIQTAADATAGDLWLRSWDGAVRSFRIPRRPGFVFPTNRPGVVMAGCTKTVGLFDLGSRSWEPLATIPDANPRTIINDGEIVPGGEAIVFGTKDTRFADPIAHLYLLTLDERKLTTIAGGQMCSNGKVFADDGRGLLLYDIDTPRKVVARYRFDLERRSIAQEGIAVDVRGRDDYPDGMCDCGDGTVIVAFYNPALAEAGRAGRFRLDTGELVEEWTTPGSQRVTCPLLVRRDGGVKLILTTATEGMPAEMRARCPNAGSLFIADTGLTSIPPAEVVHI